MAEYLDIIAPKGRQRIDLGSKAITIGRQAGNAVVINDSMASRMHCVIEPHPYGGWQVRDLNSRNGTYLNGSPIQISAFKVGDALAIGSIQILYAVETPTVPVEVVSEEDLIDEEPVNPFKQDDENHPMDPFSRLNEILAVFPGKFTENEIALINTRSQIAHAGQGEAPERYEAVAILRKILLLSHRTRASDIHIEPRRDQWQTRIRVDGLMVDIANLPRELGVRVSAVVKVLCEVDLGQRNIIQEGGFSSQFPPNAVGEPARRIHYRISFAPSVTGQKMVIRILDPSSGLEKINDLRLPHWMRQELADAIELESGMILACGPTGSGKTTTLYALIRSLNIHDRNVITIENPVEVQIDGITQLPVDEHDDRSFPNLLRSVLRQDPDVIMVGEIRDSDTARTAMQAAITGHLVFSTVHTKDTLGTIFRIIDLGAEPYMVAQGLHLVLAQRLARRLCSKCKIPVPPTPRQIEIMGDCFNGVKKIYEPKGCAKCLGTGFSGRQAFYELLKISPEMRQAILDSPTPRSLEAAIVDPRFKPLKRHGYELVADGAVSFEEIEHTIG
jgi:general secretion pathway protein E